MAGALQQVWGPIGLRCGRASRCSTSGACTSSPVLTIRTAGCRPLLSRRALVVKSHAPEVSVRARPGEKKGFIEEMRFVAMKLHTKDQAPKEGGKEAAPVPFPKWQPTREGYLRFLTESQALFGTLEEIVAEASHPEYAKFQNTGLERTAALQTDIDWFQQQYGLTRPEVQEDGPAMTYSRLLRKLAVEDPPAFICHFYNIYFAHSAGGRMIGSKVSSMILDGASLEFYTYDADLKALLEEVKEKLNQVAEGWTREQKDHCLQETEKSFHYSGALMRFITS